jgi:hypothetical protein
MIDGNAPWHRAGNVLRAASVVENPHPHNSDRTPAMRGEERDRYLPGSRAADGPPGNTIVGIARHLLTEPQRPVQVVREDAEDINDCRVDPIGVIVVGD